MSKLMDYENLDTLRCAMEITPQQVVSPHQHDFSSKADAKDHYCFTECGKVMLQRSEF